LEQVGLATGGFLTATTVPLSDITPLMILSPRRFLAVVVIATPCPLLIAIPVAVIGAISLSARRPKVQRPAGSAVVKKAKAAASKPRRTG
jgi:cation transport ATPase